MYIYRYIGTMFGLALVSHQAGGFLGAYLGGLSLTNHGDLLLTWYLDAGLCVFAALCNLLVDRRENPSTSTSTSAGLLDRSISMGPGGEN